MASLHDADMPPVVLSLSLLTILPSIHIAMNSGGMKGALLYVALVPTAFAALGRMGHETSVIDANSPLAGQAGAILIGDDGLIQGAHDPRSDGVAVGI